MKLFLGTKGLVLSQWIVAKELPTRKNARGKSKFLTFGQPPLLIACMTVIDATVIYNEKLTSRQSELAPLIIHTGKRNKIRGTPKRNKYTYHY